MLSKPHGCVNGFSIFKGLINSMRSKITIIIVMIIFFIFVLNV